MIDMGSVQDMTGQRFGRLQVLKRASNTRAGKARWRCLCKCGRKPIAIGADLRSGRIVSCGCFRREQNRAHGHRGPALVGARFGRLTVIAPARKDRHGHNRWRCKCDCGKETVVVAGSLPVTQSCGCARRGKPWHVTPARRVFADLSGRTFGRLTVVSKVRRTNGKPYWACRCSCGKNHTTSASELFRGSTASCGCLARDLIRQRVHPGTAEQGRPNRIIPGYTSWCMMRTRCLNATFPDYPHYGGRGIKVCDRWLGTRGFANFLADMGEKPDGTSLDRIDPNGNYEPGNCRWATALQQKNNQRLSAQRVRAVLARYDAEAPDLIARLRSDLLG